MLQLAYPKNIDNKNLESSPFFCYSKNSLIHKGERGEAFYVSQTICRIQFDLNTVP